MNIAVNTRLLIKDKLEGIGWFTYESLKRITTQHPEHHFYFIFDRPYDTSFIFSSNITPVVLSPQARHPLLFWFWFECRLPRLLRKLNPDIFLSTDGYLSLKTPTKSLPVFHDLNFEHNPEDLPFFFRWYYRHFFPKFAAKAVRIATVSEFSRQDIVVQYGKPSDQIDVVYDGANETYVPLSPEGINLTRKKYTSGSPYFIFIGSLHPRKNLVNLFRAFDLFRLAHPGDVKLLIVGARKWWTKEISLTFRQMKYADDVVFSGRLNSDELAKVLGASLALTYVSYFEGFGIPIVEAFRCGVPVITSNVTSMPEVAGDAALLVDPFKPSSIAGAMIKLAGDEPYRQELIRKGLERKNEFTWQRTADLLWESIEKTATST
ncbi:MAG: glycosyltransferase family 1 protein [Bacteroidetes bacterium]|nr:glycosyltransferase family 1 protein [Bacteroidota bacterium]